MIELLILYKLSGKVLTMYGISKDIHEEFSVLTTPSFGTIKPALTRLEKNGYVKGQKTMSSGGRPSIYYSITKDGVEELRRLMTSPLQENPIQFLTTARIRLSCAEVLDKNMQLEMFKLLKNKAESIVIDTKNKVANNKLGFYSEMVFDNLICECKNLISLVEGFERACKN
ncbi:MAG: PadR family transcriptional regulator [Cyanobacteria bacterium SIG31]|nr:PadR family transcriptional regulator [Cyanobacteria bacterium SIG31]